MTMQEAGGANGRGKGRATYDGERGEVGGMHVRAVRHYGMWG